MPKNIVQDGHPALRKISTPVGVVDIGNAEIKSFQQNECLRKKYKSSLRGM